jgi:NAD(P)-dependent dehydrogenase (short-subunit alcohol dehydrogenase family)
MTRRLSGQHAVVTGGGRGLGAAIAGALAAEGAALTLMARTPEEIGAQAAALASRFHGQAHAVRCDVADPKAVAQAFSAATDELGPVTILINNAGHAEAAPVDETTLEMWNQTLAVNLTGTLLCIQAVLPAMRVAQHGRIINMASTAGLHGYANVAAYCAAKHGVVGLTRALASEARAYGVTVNAVCPGYVEGTAMLETAIANVRAGGKSIDEARTLLAARSPGGRFATLSEVTKAVIDLCVADAAGKTGQAIVVNGGDLS